MKRSLPVIALLLSAWSAFGAGTTVRDIVHNLSRHGARGLGEARRLASQYAAGNGDDLGYHSTNVDDYQTFRGSYTPPKLPAKQQGRFLYGLALFSDDGCSVSVRGQKVHEHHSLPQALPRLNESFFELPVLLEPGKPVDIEVGYSNVIYNAGRNPDIDGVTLFLYLVPIEIIPDYNRDGKIDNADRGKVTQDNPWRWWVNDDDDHKDGHDRAWNGSGDMPSGSSRNNTGYDVDGIRDLVDFFPMRLDLKKVLERFPSGPYQYQIKHDDEAVNFLEMPDANPQANAGAAGHLLSVQTATALASKRLQSTRRSRYHLSAALLEASANGRGMILCEGVKDSNKPLILEVTDDRSQVAFRYELPILISRVEKMYRHLNLRDQLPEGYRSDRGDLPTRIGNPGKPYPDALTNGTYFVYLHGFANDDKVARASFAEIFKRLYQMGSRARFVGVSWPGDTQPNYHKAVHRAFLVGDMLADRLPKDGNIVLAAHSLGNMVASQAIEYGGLKVRNYLMLNAASAIEAYDTNQTKGVDDKDMQEFMTEEHWQDFLPHRRKLFAADWHRLFSANDGRSKLTWKGRFARRVPKVATNFYSTGEDVVQNPKEALTVAEYLVDRVKRFNFAEQAWVAQEITKGSDLLGRVIVPGTHAGWHRNNEDPEWEQINNQENWEQRIDDLVSNAFVRSHPFYEPFKYPELYDPAKGSAMAKKKHVQYELLATAIPAMSYAVAANPVNAFNRKGENFNMMDMKTDDQWPRGDDTGKWLHGDFRMVALCYVHQMYSKMITIGKLNN